MTTTINAQLNAKGKRFSIVVGRFNEFISSKLLGGAIDCIVRHGGNESDIRVVWVPGSFEIPLVSKLIANKGDQDAIICLGAVIRGSTSHFDFVSNEVAKGISKVALDSEIPVIFGVLTTDTIEQAIERAGTKMGNKGWESALSAIEMAEIKKLI